MINYFRNLWHISKGLGLTQLLYFLWVTAVTIFYAFFISVIAAVVYGAIFGFAGYGLYRQGARLIRKFT